MLADIGDSMFAPDKLFALILLKCRATVNEISGGDCNGASLYLGHLMRKLILSMAVGVASTAMAAPPQHVEINYELARNDLVLADIYQRLDHDGHTYHLTETWKGRGFLSLHGDVVRSSEGAIMVDGLRPQKFEDRRSGRDTQRVEFDPAAKTPTLERQDRLSMVWTFAFAPLTAATVKIIATDNKGATTFVFHVAGRERLKTPAGEFDALKLVKVKDNPEQKTTEIWFAVDRNYIPIRVLVIDKDGTRVDQVAAKISVP